MPGVAALNAEVLNAVLGMAYQRIPLSMELT